MPKAVVEDAGRLLSFETLRERELREFVQQMTGEKQDPDWPTLRERAAETPAERDLREFVEHITGVHEYHWDPAEHPRGAFSQNRGWFSPTGGSSLSGSTSRGVPRSVPGGGHYEPMRSPAERADHPVIRVPATGDAGGQTRGFRSPDEPQTVRQPGHPRPVAPSGTFRRRSQRCRRSSRHKLSLAMPRHQRNPTGR